MDKDEIVVHLNMKLVLNERLNKKDLQRYIKEAVEHWGGQFHPSDPFFKGVKRCSTFFPKVSP